MLILIALLLAAGPKQHDWLGSEMPLPLTVSTPQDLAFKNMAERQYLIFNLLAAGKIAWDQRDFATAAAKWETLLSLPGLDPEVDKVVRPLAEEARKQGGGKAASLPPPPPPREESAERTPPRERRSRAAAAETTVDGTVSGGGNGG